MRQVFFRNFEEGHCLVTFLNGGQCFQTILKFTSRRPRSQWIMTYTSTSEAQYFLYRILLLKRIIITNNLNYYCTYKTRMIIGYTVQNITTNWNVSE